MTLEDLALQTGLWLTYRPLILQLFYHCFIIIIIIIVIIILIIILSLPFYVIFTTNIIVCVKSSSMRRYNTIHDHCLLPTSSPILALQLLLIYPTYFFSQLFVPRLSVNSLISESVSSWLCASSFFQHAEPFFFLSLFSLYFFLSMSHHAMSVSLLLILQCVTASSRLLPLLPPHCHPSSY